MRHSLLRTVGRRLAPYWEAFTGSRLRFYLSRQARQPKHTRASLILAILVKAERTRVQRVRTVVLGLVALGAAYAAQWWQGRR